MRMRCAPGRMAAVDPSAARWLDFAGDGAPFRFLSEVGRAATPTYAGAVNIDHVLADTLTGTCLAAGVHAELPAAPKAKKRRGKRAPDPGASPQVPEAGVETDEPVEA